MKAVRVNEFGGPEALSVEELEVPSPADHEVLVKIEAAGLNYIDTYQRSGLYQIPLPTTLGMEGAGSVVAAGPDVEKPETGRPGGVHKCDGRVRRLHQGIRRPARADSGRSFLR